MDLEPIHNSVIDPTTILYPNHNVFTHLGCVLVRVGLGLSIMNIGKDSDKNKVISKHNTIVVLLTILIIVFLVKRIKMDKETFYWKSYIRMLVAYSVALFMVMRKEYSNAGLLVIVDALMGLQSRHSASVASRICKEKNNSS